MRGKSCTSSKVRIHAKNITNKRYITLVYRYINGDAAGNPILNVTEDYTPTLGKEGVATPFYGNPRQVFVSFGLNV